MSTHRRAMILACIALLIGGLGAWLGLSWLHGVYTEDSANFTLIEPGLYMGGDVQDPPRGTNAVLNLCETQDRYRCANHRWEPIRDAAPAPDLDWLRRQVEFVDTERRAGRTIYVHCRNGVSRSGMVVAAYLMLEHAWDRDEALAFIRERRPIVRPNGVFMELLNEWHVAIRPQK